ncbi:MAG: hypothetical protein EP332_13115, partial [Bacteroidetes bacterium]
MIQTLRIRKAFSIYIQIILLLILTLPISCSINNKSTNSLMITYNNYESLSRLIDSSVQIVGIGAATHGSNEVDLYQTDVAKLLINKNGFRTILIESAYQDGLIIGNYIHSKEVNTKTKELIEIYFSQKYVDFFNWIRNFNLEDTNKNDPIRLFAIDRLYFNNIHQEDS